MEDFVTYDLALKLKDKGFDYPCVGHYVNNQLYVAHYHNAFHSYKDESIDVPIISQVLKWLREEKKYHIEFVGNACGYLFIVSDIPSEGGTDRYCSDYSGPNDGGTWDKYEDCAIAGIEYVLDNII